MKRYKLVEVDASLNNINKLIETAKDALKTKEVWESKWHEHTKNHISNYPCWYDSEPTLKIEEINTDDDLLVIKKLNADN